MFITGVDYHPSFQEIAFLDQETGECGERRLNHSDGEAEKFYRDLQQRGISVRVGLEFLQGFNRPPIIMVDYLPRLSFTAMESALEACASPKLGAPVR
jgi:hypothetical protein